MEKKLTELEVITLLETIKNMVDKTQSIEDLKTYIDGIIQGLSAGYSNGTR